MTFDVLVLGGSGVDTIVYVPELPLPYADSYMVPAIEARPGQTGDNVALALHKLGLRVHHLDVTGDDHEGELLRELHRANGVPFTPVLTSAGTKRAVNLVGPGGQRLSLYDISRGNDDDRLPEAELTALMRQARHAHVSITHPCQFALDHLTGLTVSTDLHNWDGHNPYHEQFAYRADIVFLSAAGLSDHETVLRRILDNGKAEIAVATAGADGCFVLTRAHGAVVHVPAAPLPGPAVDSNGAGDAFVAGFLHAWLAGASALDSARAGAVAGAHACTVR